jgi:3-hydroxyacyl-CoA dehydrogenase
VASADLVQENGPEWIDFKKRLYGQLDDLLPPEVIIASSSSGLTMSEIQSSLRTLAKPYGINHKTVAKWKQRETVADLPTGPKEAKSTVLSIEEEAIIVAIRLPCRRCSPNGFTRSPERHTEGEIT